jgi:GT2 family glycosyltransferase
VNVSVLIATYGDVSWMMTAVRAVASASDQGAYEVLDRHEARGTISSSRNALAGRASGDWLLFLDADDELAPGYIEAMSVAVHQNLMDPMKLYTPAVRHVKKGRPAAPFFFDRGISLRQDNWLVVGTLVHKDLFHEVGGFGDYPHGFEDWSLWSKCFRAGAQVIKVPDAVYVYHHNPQSKHKQGWRNRKWQMETHQRVAAELDEWEASRT